MANDEAIADTFGGPDNPPLTGAQLRAAPRMARIKVIRRAFDLSQEEFSSRYQIPLDTIRDWEEGRSEPDAPALAYLKVIAASPEVIAKLLVKKSSS